MAHPTKKCEKCRITKIRGKGGVGRDRGRVVGGVLWPATAKYLIYQNIGTKCKRLCPLTPVVPSRGH